MKTELVFHVPASNTLPIGTFLVKAIEVAIALTLCALGAGPSSVPRAPEVLIRVLTKNDSAFFDKGRLAFRGDTNKARGLLGMSDVCLK